MVYTNTPAYEWDMPENNDQTHMAHDAAITELDRGMSYE